MSHQHSVDTNELIRILGYDRRPDVDFGEVARFAASLNHLSVVEIEEALIEEFGRTEPLRIMKQNSAPLQVFNNEDYTLIDEQTISQMYNVTKLPVTTAGALMPDAHLGYAMPIGGVAVLENAVSPSFVGYDIACRMTLSILADPVEDVRKFREEIFEAMKRNSRFGMGSHFESPRDDNVMYDPLWEELPHLKNLKDKAQRQLGTSGGGNHFFDLMSGVVVADSPWMSLSKGEVFGAFMTHSGSRGAGHKLATYYQKKAKEYTAQVAKGIPNGYEWLDLDTEIGFEYWQVMQLMGRYAQANHNLIHNSTLNDLRIRQLERFENHHNFAWIYDAEKSGVAMHDPTGKYIVHRKGATPALKGQIGIIPGSSGTESYLVEGLGNPSAIYSSSHGAGRTMSRTAAKKQFDQEDYGLYEKEDILFHGIGLDELPGSYKDINNIIELQEGILVRVIAKMYPMAVIMGGKSDDGD